MQPNSVPPSAVTTCRAAGAAALASPPCRLQQAFSEVKAEVRELLAAHYITQVGVAGGLCGRAASWAGRADCSVASWLAGWGSGRHSLPALCC